MAILNKNKGLKATFLLLLFATFLMIIWFLIFYPLHDIYVHFDMHPMDILDDRMDEINKLQKDWQHAFYELFIIPTFIHSFSANSEYAQNLRHIYSDKAKAQSLHDLMNATHSFFHSFEYITENKAFISMYHRQIICIRRYLIILYQHHQHTATSSTKLYNSLLNKIFIKIRIKFVDIMQHHPRYRK